MFDRHQKRERERERERENAFYIELSRIFFSSNVIYTLLLALIDEFGGWSIRFDLFCVYVCVRVYALIFGWKMNGGGGGCNGGDG